MVARRYEFYVPSKSRIEHKYWLISFIFGRVISHFHITSYLTELCVLWIL